MAASTIATAPRGLRRRGSAARLIAADLLALGIDVDCLPLADVPVAEADPVIGDRAYGTTPEKVAALAAAVARGPDGRAACCRCSSTSRAMAAPPPTATSTCRPSMPTRATLEATDFQAFRPLRNLPLGMTAHVVFTTFDPSAPATTSPIIISKVIREFDRLLRGADE